MPISESSVKKQQQTILKQLLSNSTQTVFGQNHTFGTINNYDEFTDKVPLQNYSSIQSSIRQLKNGKEDLYWPGRINNFAVSAGTSGDGKHLPLSAERLNSDKRFMQKVALSYLRQRPNIFNLVGHHISLPGLLEKKDQYLIGEISGFSALHAPFLLRPLQFFSADEMTDLSFSKKIDRVLEHGADHDVRVLTAAPNWVLTIFQKLLKQTGKQSITEIWPNLQLLVCGGVKLANYRPHIEALLDENHQVDFIETYGASEGYIAYSDKLGSTDLKLVYDNGIFYEFIPNPKPDQESLKRQSAVPLWEVKPNTPYAILVSTNAGLWRYTLNDIVQFSDTDKPRINVMGRVSDMLDDYGEALFAYEAKSALKKTATHFDIRIGNFAVGAQMDSNQKIPRHFWFVHSSASISEKTLNRLATQLDQTIQQMNRHYTIRRESGSLGSPKVIRITQQDINHWLKQQDKEKAQGKLPAILRNDADINFFKSSSA